MSGWKPRIVYFFEEAPFFKLLLPLVAAIVCYDVWDGLHGYALLSGVSFGVVLIAAFVARRFSSSISTVLTHLSVFLLGLGACHVTDVRQHEAFYGNQLKEATVFAARVEGLPDEKAKTWKIPVSMEEAFVDGKAQASKGKGFLYLYKSDAAPDYRPGDVILVPNGWQRITNAGNPYEFNYARYAGKSGIWYQQFVGQDAVRLFDTSGRRSFFIQNVHSWGMAAFEKYITHKPTLGLLQAMLLGDETNLDEETRTVYQETGIVHIVSISGSHIAFFFLLVGWLFFWLPKRYQWVNYLVALSLIWLYVLIAGAPIPAIRSAVMFSFLAVGHLLQKEKNPLNTLLGTAVVMLLIQPMWLFSIGFQLSFVAVLSLVVFYGRIAGLWHPGNVVVRHLWQLVAASLAVEILVAPLVIYYFHLFPVGFLVANMFAYVFMGLLMIGGLLVLVSNILSLAGVAAFVGGLCSWLTKAFSYVLEFFQSLNPKSFAFIHLPLPQALLVYGIIVFAAVAVVNRNSRALVISLAGCCLLLMLSVQERWTAMHQEQFIVYNTSGGSYAEKIDGQYYLQVGERDSISERNKKFAVDNMHVVSGAWKEQRADEERSVFTISNQSVVMLHQPVKPTSQKIAADYVVLTYPVENLNINTLRQTFDFKKLIITGKQKRYLAQQWKDSLEQQHIPVHFTQSDGAFALSAR